MTLSKWPFSPQSAPATEGNTTEPRTAGRWRPGEEQLALTPFFPFRFLIIISIVPSQQTFRKLDSAEHGRQVQEFL